jgi:hypothetical protein
MTTMADTSATRAPKRQSRCTEFQLRLREGTPVNVVDFTERKLVRLASSTTDPQQRLILMALIIHYRAGLVAVAWRRGHPVSLRVTNA